MIFNEYFHLEGKHAFLSPSQYHWINYDDEKLEVTYKRRQAAALGTRLHEFAAEAISLGIKLPRTNKTINMYVNDAIGFRMQPERVLYFSDNAFGTADAIKFDRGLLRIHDLKTGITPASVMQLEVYAALFCLEYDVSPNDIKMELRIYQNDDVLIHVPDPNDILGVMNKIIHFDKQIEFMKAEEV